MKYKLYNQNDYGSVPYPAPGYENATVKSGGCGAVCAAMLVENLTGEPFPPERAAAYAIGAGARVSGGTDMRKLAKSLGQSFGLTVEMSDKVSRLTACLSSGGMAIANAGGDRQGYKGVFSNGGHYVAVFGLSGGQLIIGDPGLYSGKYDKPYRKTVTVSTGLCYAEAEVLDRDCANRSPRYYLFAKEEEEVTQEQFESMMESYLAQRGREEASAWAAREIERAKAAGITDGARPRAFATREEVMAMVLRAQEGGKQA